MAIAEYNVEDFQNRDNADKGLLVKFFVKPWLDQGQTQKEGRPIYVDKEYIDIRVPGSRDNICRPASLEDKQRFAEHYRMFKERTSEDPKITGTLLKEWPLISRSQAENLAFINVKTVEQLAEVADVHISQMMGMNQLKAKAKEWLEAAKEREAAQELEAKLEQRDDQIAELTAAVAELSKQLKTLQATKPKRKKVTRKKATAKKE